MVEKTTIRYICACCTCCSWLSYYCFLNAAVRGCQICVDGTLIYIMQCLTQYKIPYGKQFLHVSCVVVLAFSVCVVLQDVQHAQNYSKILARDIKQKNHGLMLFGNLFI
ncbi:hypothetical protein pb186bvf_008192 [Paramecium bursaria]